MGTDVTIVEFMPNVVPVEDEDISKQMERSLKKAGIKIMTSSSVERIDTSGKGVKAFVKTAKGEEVLEADILLSAVGIKTNIENIGLEEVGIAVDKDKSGGCFIATACYGSYDDSNVLILRNYRDNYLSNTFFGRFFIKTYYFLSPPIARFISQSDKLKSITRFIIIDPLVSIVRKKLS